LDKIFGSRIYKHFEDAVRNTMAFSNLTEDGLQNICQLKTILEKNDGTNSLVL
jgi:hypothetical protein